MHEMQNNSHCGRTMLKHLVICFVLNVVFATEKISRRSFFYEYQYDGVCLPTGFRLKSDSVIHCGVSCKKNPLCFRFMFNETEKSCTGCDSGPVDEVEDGHMFGVYYLMMTTVSPTTNNSLTNTGLITTTVSPTTNNSLTTTKQLTTMASPTATNSLTSTDPMTTTVPPMTTSSLSVTNPPTTSNQTSMKNAIEAATSLSASGSADHMSLSQGLQPTGWLGNPPNYMVVYGQDFLGSEGVCQLHKARLAIIESREENNHVAFIIKTVNQRSTSGKINVAFIGARIDESGNAVYYPAETNVNPTLYEFIGVERSETIMPLCMAISPDKFWLSFPCDYKMPAICEKRL